MFHVFSIAKALINIHLLKKRTPLFLSWNITFRCNLRCQYCAACDAPPEELTTEEIKAGLDALWKLGTRWITFGGGEPLIRQDIGEIVQYARSRGFQCYLSTNGSLLKSKLESIKPGVQHINLSLDGSETVHDQVRGKGSYAKAIEALELCKSSGISVSLQCVLNRYNLDDFHKAVETAQHYKVPIMFQPATKWLSTSLESNPIAPDTAPYREAIQKIIALKQSGAPVRNSYTGLKHLAHWPDPQPIFCAAGKSMAILEADGSMLACHQCQVKDFLHGTAASGTWPEKFKNMPLPKHCAQCWCAPVVELCLFFSLKPEAMLNALRYR